MKQSKVQADGLKHASESIGGSFALAVTPSTHRIPAPLKLSRRVAALANVTIEGGFVLAAFDVQLDFKEHFDASYGNSTATLVTLLRERKLLTDKLKSLCRPLVIIPASLHPIDLGS